MYATGQGVPQDYVLAYMWSNLAAAQGHEVAVLNRDGAARKCLPTRSPKHSAWRDIGNPRTDKASPFPQRRRIASRYDKLAENTLVALKLVSVRIWLRGNDSTSQNSAPPLGTKPRSETLGLKVLKWMTTTQTDKCTADRNLGNRCTAKLPRMRGASD
ncbi:hypothetical protein [Mesorhizobium sp. M1329]|uniref:hypothetical protein n=1 Tax=Mesorhizobium sp. M1329 TaxID=2957083 RepID=UPI00333E1310